MINTVWASKIERPLWRASLQTALPVLALFVAYRVGAMAPGADWRILLLPVAATATVVVLTRPRLGVYLITVWILLLPTDLDELPGPSVADSVAEWLLYATTLGAALQAVRDRRLPFLEGKVGPALVVYAAFVLLQLVRSGEAGETRKLAFAYLWPALIYFLTVTLIESHEQLERLILALLLANILYFGIRLYFHVPTIDTELVFARAGGTYAESWYRPGKPSVWLANMLVPWAVILSVAYPSRAARLLGAVLSAGAMFYSATSTFRLGAVGAVVGTLAVLVSTQILTPRKRWQTRVLVILFLIVAAAVVIKTPIAAKLELAFRVEFVEIGQAGRSSILLANWRRFLANPLTGGGIYGGGGHSTFLNVLGSWGLLVGIPMVWLWSVLVAERYRLWRKARSSHLRAIAAASFAAMLPAVVDSLLDHTFMAGAGFSVIFWILCGITTVSLRLANAEEALSDDEEPYG